ncbi:hypothetical protein Tco_0588028 [Tanacetum coccineum]
MSFSDDDQFCYGTGEAQNFTWTSPFFTDRVYGSLEDMKNWVKNTAYSLVVNLTDPDQVKNTSSKKTGYPFKLVGKYSFEQHYWTIRVVCDQHNHRPTEHLEAHAYARRLSDDEFRLVEDLTWKNVPPHEILTTLKDQDENNLSTLPTIYDAHKKSARSRETEKLQCSDWEIFVSMWKLLEDSPTWTSYEENYEELQTFLSKYPRVLSYIRDTWLDKYKKHFVSASIDQCLNFGNRTSNRAESQHAKFKKYMHNKNTKLDKFVACINKIVQSQLTAIRQSFGRSEISRYHHHNIHCFNFLRGFVSKEALDLMVKEMNREDGFPLDSSTCGCQLYNSCGLPCACRLSFYMTSGECIPLDSIDIFWRTLDISPVTSLQKDSICCDTELNHFKEHFNKQSDVGKRSVLRKLVDIFNPSKTTIKPPPVKQNTRGRPSLKKQQQQRKHVPPKSSRSGRFSGIDLNVEPERQNSYMNNKQQEKKRSFSCKSFDIDLNMQPRRHSSFSNSQRGQTHNSIPDLNEEPARHSSFVSPMPHQLSETEILFRQIPSIFHPYISSSSIQNVKPDGNCGFRSVSLVLSEASLSHPEDYWPRIRWDLVHELEYRQHEYRRMFGTKIITTSMVHPPQSDSHEIIVIAHVNGNHFIRVDLREGFPLPRTHPMWNAYKSDNASGWRDRYVSRQNIFRDYYYRDPVSYDLS